MLMETGPNSPSARSGENSHKDSELPSLTVMICTVGAEGLASATQVVLPPMAGVDYVVSVQGVAEGATLAVPAALQRHDVTVSCLSGRGLSRNRNHALSLAKGELLLVADDDEQLLPDGLRELRRCMDDHPNVDIALFRYSGPDGTWPKRYPALQTDYAFALRRGYYASSVEIALRRRVADIGIRFNELFGLGAPELCAGEESVLLCDAARRGLRIRLFPVRVGTTDLRTTGTRFLESTAMQRSKGATFQYCHGTLVAMWLCLREAAHYAVRRQGQPSLLLRHMIEGIRYARRYAKRPSSCPA